jgi:two-component system chemotaxis response regulator CheY
MSKQIMIVDDSMTMRKMVTFALQESGYRVEQAADGQQALAWLSKHHADLVITDLHMPVMDGITLIEALRKLAAYRTTPILVLTTDSSDEKKQQSKAAGATGWIIKPFISQELCQTLQRLLEFPPVNMAAAAR